MCLPRFMPRFRNNLLFTLTIIVLTSTVTRAYWFDNTATTHNLNKYTMELIYDMGKRDIFERFGRGFLRYGDGQLDSVELNPKKNIRLRHHRSYVQYNADISGFGGYGQGFIRILPNTGRLNFEGSQYNSNLFGGGFGVKFSPRNTSGTVRIGVLASWDWNYGIQENKHSYPSQKLFSDGSITNTVRRDEVNWTEGTIVLGISNTIRDSFTFYGGISFIRAKIFLELGNEYQTNWRADNDVGGYFGINWSPLKRWAGFVVALESHFINEDILGLSMQYRYRGE